MYERVLVGVPSTSTSPRCLNPTHPSDCFGNTLRCSYYFDGQIKRFRDEGYNPPGMGCE